jgi:hypothetical protein
MKKERIGFTIDPKTRQLWDVKSKEVVDRRFFRNKTDIFESLVFFLNKATDKELIEFREKITRVTNNT